MKTAPHLSTAELETVYDLLATAIDETKPEDVALFLVKLALLNADALGDAERFRAHVAAAQNDLSGAVCLNAPSTGS